MAALKSKLPETILKPGWAKPGEAYTDPEDVAKYFIPLFYQVPALLEEVIGMTMQAGRSPRKILGQSQETDALLAGYWEIDLERLDRLEKGSTSPADVTWFRTPISSKLLPTWNRFKQLFPYG